MIIGTWAEWLCSDYFAARHGRDGYRVDIGRTHDIDVFFRDHLMEIEGADRLPAKLQDAGFFSPARRVASNPPPETEPQHLSMRIMLRPR